jgi:hypothetical protein
MVDIPANTATLSHAAKSIVTALTLGLLPFLHLAEANAAPAVLVSSPFDQSSGLVLKAAPTCPEGYLERRTPYGTRCIKTYPGYCPSGQYNSEGRCIKSIRKVTAQEACENKGPKYRYDPQTGGCIKQIGKSKEPQPQEAQPQTEQTGDEGLR